MLSRRTNPMIGRLSELLVSGNRAAGFLDVATAPSPRSPLLDYRIHQSPRGLKNYDIGGVGLGIVAALEKSSTGTSTRSEPIPVTMALGVGIHKGMLEKDSLEDYTFVTRHGPDNQSLTMVYCDQSQKGFESGAVKEIPAAPSKFGDEFEYPTSDFLRCCHLCKKKLHGRDIYMYRGEKAFCSAECRSSQIMKDERKEQCRSEVQRTADVSASSYTTTPIFSTGILAL